MTKLPNEINDQFVRFLKGEISLKAFEQWVYNTPLLEGFLSEDDYLELISASYSKKYSKHDLSKLIRPYIDFGEYETQRLKRLLVGIIERDSNLPDLLSELYHLYYMGYSFLDSLAIGYALSIEVPPHKYGAESWEELSRDAQDELLSSLYPGVVDEAKRALGWLEEGVIIPSGNWYDQGYYDFEDRRSDVDGNLGESNLIPDGHHGRFAETNSMEKQQNSRFRLMRLLFGLLLGVFLCGALNAGLYLLLGQTETGPIFGRNGLAIAIGLGVISGVLLGSIWAVVRSKHGGKLTAGILGPLMGLLISFALYMVFRDFVVFRGPNLFIGFFVTCFLVFAGLIFGLFVGTAFDIVWLIIGQQIEQREHK